MTMDNDTLRVILSQLEAIQRKQDTQGEQLRQITERLATMETKQDQQEDLKKSVNELQSIVDRGMGAKYVICILASFALSILSLIK